MNISDLIESNKEKIIPELFEWAETFDWELDETHINHLKELGLWDTKTFEEGDEFIDRL